MELGSVVSRMKGGGRHIAEAAMQIAEQARSRMIAVCGEGGYGETLERLGWQQATERYGARMDVSPRKILYEYTPADMN